MSQFSQNPYEAIVNGASSSRPAEKRAEKRPAPPSSVLSKATKRKQVQKPSGRLGVQYRYQFEMPPPTMDCKMLLGHLSPASFADPIFTALERGARPVAAPGDPNHGLRANLVEPSIYGESPPLSVEDDALLLAIEAERPGASPATQAKLRSAQKGAALPPPRRAVQAPAPWMRRMSYEEYLGKSTNISRPTNVNINMNGPTALGVMTKSPARKAPSPVPEPASIERSFQLAHKMPKHPDKRKAHMKPTSIVPVFPDFTSIGAEFIAIEFERGAVITHEERMKDPELLDKSTRSMATISLAEDDKKFLACFTPSDSTLEAQGDNARNAVDDDEKDDEGEASLMYDWVHEYSIREGGKGQSTPSRHKGVVKPTRGCFALAEHEGPGGKKIATLGRIGTNWKLSRRLGTLPRLGKPHLRLNSVSLSKEAEDQKLLNSLGTIERSI